jgi:hypothetical protein
MLIEAMINAEWRALELEADAGAAETKKEKHTALNLAAKWRRQLLLLDRDLVRATGKPSPQPPEKPKTLAEHLAAKEAARQ